MKNQRIYCPYCMTPISGNASCPNCGLTAGAYVPLPHHLPPGTLLMDRYLVGRVLGEGGFGITYIGCDLRLELKVAIKEYYPVDKASRNASQSLALMGYSVGPAREGFERGKKKFLNEARAMAKMDKQQVIVSVRDFFEANNTAYIVMEYIEGTTFTELVAQRGGRLSPQELFPMIEPLFQALSTLHKGGLIHRDISPDNLMLENGEVRLIDFGCARESEHGDETLTITLKHGYAPIEQYQQKGQGPWTDVYALCATIYFCLVGKKPPQSLDRIGGESDLLLPSKLGVAITPQREAAIFRGLNLSPRGRFQTMEELHGALYPAVLPEPGPPNPVPPEPVPPEPVPPEPVPPEPVPPNDVTITSDVVDPPNIPSLSRLRQFLGGKGRYVALGGVFVLAVAICLVGLRLGSNAPEQTPVVQETTTQPSQTPAPEVDWDAAYTLTAQDLTAEGLQRLMEDPAVSALVLPGEMEWTLRGAALTKPLRVEQGATLRVQELSVEDGGFLEVYGLLDARYGSLRLWGESARLAFPNGTEGCFQGERSSLWLETSMNMAVADLAFAREDGAYTLIFQEDLDGAQEVSTLAELKAAQDCRLLSGIKITQDIVLDEPLTFSCPVYICEGVTLSSAPQDPSGEDLISLSLYSGRAVLINYGTLSQAFLWMGAGASICNYGAMDTSLWMDCDGPNLFWNAGRADFSQVSRIWEGNHFLNASTGTLVAQGLIVLSDSVLNNLGLLQVVWNAETQEESLVLQAGACLNNLGGAITVAEGAVLRNYGVLHNQGLLEVQSGTEFDNNALVENRQGTFLVASDASLTGMGIYCSTGGRVELLCGDQPQVYSVLSEAEAAQLAAAAKAATAGQLQAMLEDPQVEAIAISGDLTYTGRLTVTKDLYITGTLTISEGSLMALGSKILVAEGGSLEAQNVSLLENAVVQLDGGVLSLPEGGKLVLDASLVLGGGDSRLNAPGAQLLLRNSAAIGVRHGGSAGFLALDGSDIRLEDRATCLSGCLGTGVLTGVTLTMSGSTFEAGGQLYFQDSTISLEGGGVLMGVGKSLTLDACDLSIAQDGTMETNQSDLLFQNTILRNDGNLFLHSWDEYSLHLDSSQIYNNQTFHLFMPTTFSGNGTAIYNQGDLETFQALDGYVIGKVPHQE